MSSTLHRGIWLPDDRQESIYRYLPFEVSPGTRGLMVQLDYDREAGVLDLGCFGPGGFRGWSGGARAGFAITSDWATPGYLPGELEPGTWYVVLGLYRVDPRGVRYELRVHDSAPPRPPAPTPPPVPRRPPRRRLPAASGRTWLAGDLHAHTDHSDGAMTVDELACLAAGRGLDFLAVTDHNTVSHHPWLPAAGHRAGIALVAGQELTATDGHAGALGDIGWVDFREGADAWLANVGKRHGLLSINHPVRGHVAWRRPMTGRPSLVEVWHWSWRDRSRTEPLDWWQEFAPEAVPVGGSDWHRGHDDAPPGAPTTWVACPADADPADDAAGPAAFERAVLDALRSGQVAVSAERDGPVIVRVDDELVAHDADGTVLVSPSSRHPVRGQTARFAAQTGLHRLVDDKDRTLALTP